MSETRTSRRVSMTQLLHLCEFLNVHREIAVGYNKSTQAREHKKRMWETAADVLNSAGEGAVKSASEWSKYWVDMKAKLKKKNRLICDSRRRTGGGPGINLELSEIDRKFLTITYWVDMKAKLKKKNRLICDSRRRTGGGPGINLELSEIDRKFLSILGEDLGSGLPGIRVEPPESIVLQEYGDNVTGPSNMDTSQSTATEESIYLVPSSEEYQQSEPNAVMGAVMASQHSAQSPIPNRVPDSVNPQPSPSRQGSTRQEIRPRFLLPTEAEPSPLLRQGIREQGPRRRRRRLRQQLSAADAREQLVTATERRTQAELANSRSLERVADFLGDIVSLLRNIQAG